MKHLASLAVGLAIALAAPAIAASNLQSAVFSGGCFWSMQHDLEHVPGVTDTVVGYAGGTQPHPTYEQVSSESTGYLESIKVTFDPAKITYAQLVQRYWHAIDPTDAGGAFCDRGHSYQSAIFVDSPEQRHIAEASKAVLEQGALKGRIVTPIRDAGTFWPAEGYHQHYSDKNPEAYGEYRTGCGKDAALRRIWGPLALK
jgi:peptide-methionine (S)-S-oxide reductase